MPVKLDDQCGLDEGLEIAALNDGLGESAPGHPCLLQSFNNRVSSGDSTISSWLSATQSAPYPPGASQRKSSRLGASRWIVVGDLDWQDERRR